MADMTIRGVGQAVPEIAGKSGQATGGEGFGTVLKQAMNGVNASLQEADGLVAGLVSGQHANIHETMIAMEKAGIELRLVTKMQNKVVEAYKEIMRIQV